MLQQDLSSQAGNIKRPGRASLYLRKGVAQTAGAAIAVVLERLRPTSKRLLGQEPSGFAHCPTGRLQRTTQLTAMTRMRG